MKDYSVLDGTKRDQIAKFDFAYDKGYEQGYLDGKDEAYKNPVPTQDAYQRGLADAWHVFERVATPCSSGGLTLNQKVSLFNSWAYEDIVKFSPIEAVEKLKVFEQEITVGDEVIDNGKRKGVVTWISEAGHFYMMFSDGSVGVATDVKKTGRHFGEVNKIVEAMQEGKE